MSKYKECENCGKSFKVKGNTEAKFCCRKCQAEKEYKDYIERWKNGQEDGLKGEYGISTRIRRYLFEKFDSKCCICGWSETNPYTGNIPLEIEHIDGDYKNNKEDNLLLLCPNCHSLTSTYKGANVGNGRKNRNKYYDNKNKKEEYDKSKHTCPVCGKLTRNKITCSKECFSVYISENPKAINENCKRISKDELTEKLRQIACDTLTFVEFGKEYDVSDNTIRNWCKIYNLPYKIKDIKEYFSSGF